MTSTFMTPDIMFFHKKPARFEAGKLHWKHYPVLRAIKGNQKFNLKSKVKYPKSTSTPVARIKLSVTADLYRLKVDGIA